MEGWDETDVPEPVAAPAPEPKVEEVAAPRTPTGFRSRRWAGHMLSRERVRMEAARRPAGAAGSAQGAARTGAGSGGAKGCT